MKYCPRVLISLLVISILFCSCQKEIAKPEPFGAVPSERQMNWHKMKYYAFVHFNINTFSDLEWGHGNESPEIFNPTSLDCRQWARVCKAAGMKAIIITAKHHDGFCLWPSKYSNHTVKNSPWKNGEGDVLKELSEACKEYGLKMGVYLSPWDRNSPIYGKPEYNEYFKNQLTEVLTNYGEIFEVWFDGAVGEGYKGQQIYDWQGYIETVRKYQPNAVIFSDSGPDIRWVGTEKGFANPTNWSTLNKDDYYPGTPKYIELRSGNKNGTHWIPAEVNTSIRPGWYYHQDEDDAVKSVDHLELIYYNSIGRNGNFLLNLPVDRRGLVHENDETALNGLKERLDATFSKNLIEGAKIISADTRGATYNTLNLLDGIDSTFWISKEDQNTATLEIQLVEEQIINVVTLGEYLPLGQRIDSVSIEVWENDQWEMIGQATTIGRTRFIRIPRTTTKKLRINILSALAPPSLASIALYFRPHENYLLEPIQTGFNSLKLTNNYAQKYAAGGDSALGDGKRGSKRFTDLKWQGFDGVDFEAIVDLGEKRLIENIAIHFLQNQEAWIFGPEQVQFSISKDGKNFENIYDSGHHASHPSDEIEIHDYSLAFGVETRFVKIYAQGVKNCPTWHPGNGEKCWLFTDEIIIQ